jgi:oxalate decarboxylase
LGPPEAGCAPSLSDWLTHTPPSLLAAHFNLSLEDIAKFPNNIPIIMPV